LFLGKKIPSPFFAEFSLEQTTFAANHFEGVI
jgi:hypothetical protein